MAVTIRLRPKTHQALKETTQITGETMQEALDRAVEERRRRVYLEGLAADYAALNANPKTRRDRQAEDQFWDQTNSDGLEEA